MIISAEFYMDVTDDDGNLSFIDLSPGEQHQYPVNPHVHSQGEMAEKRWSLRLSGHSYGSSSFSPRRYWGNPGVWDFIRAGTLTLCGVHSFRPDRRCHPEDRIPQSKKAGDFATIFIVLFCAPHDDVGHDVVVGVGFLDHDWRYLFCHGCRLFLCPK